MADLWKSADAALSSIAYYVNPNLPPFMSTVAVIFLCPLIWNSIARTFRYYTHTLQPNTSTGTRYALCYAMTVWIFAFSCFRDWLFHQTVYSQPSLPALSSLSSITHPLAAALIAFGQLLVLSSFYQLGITGTFLGDYVGILMQQPVTAFPFSLFSNPMYVGSTLCFVGSSLWYDSLAGLCLSGWIWLVYAIALQFEGPYTDMIYRQRDEKKKRGKKAQ